MQKNLEQEFHSYCTDGNLEFNLNQVNVVKKLEEYYSQNFDSSFLNLVFRNKINKKGFYLYGDVGVGKTMLLDFFYNLIVEKKNKTSL